MRIALSILCVSIVLNVCSINVVMAQGEGLPDHVTSAALRPSKDWRG